jgi:diadenosine tetraphosphate (Ap4A) HIT family hydrolase
MSINPMAYGHALVVPVEEIDHWIDASAELATHLFDVTRIVGHAQQAAFAPERVSVIIAGYEVPHTHIHVIPTNDMSEVSFANAAASVEREDLESAANAIRAALVAAGHEESVDGLTS